MPIPTDTFWNIKRLNVVFALSGIALMAVTAWAIFQDYGHDWRKHQQQARVWEAALVDDKIQREFTPAQQKRLEELEKQIAEQEKAFQTHSSTYDDLIAQRNQKQSDRATLEFKYNNDKSRFAVDERELQDASAANETEHVAKLNQRMQGPREKLAADAEQLAKLANEIADLRVRADAEVAQTTALKKQRTDLTAEVESLRKRRDALQPSNIFAKTSTLIRDMPLMGFVNPSDKVQQIVLPDVHTDVAFMKIATVDRCMTCHTNINKKDFTEEKVIAYLEEQIATARKLKLPEVANIVNATSPNATASKPGPVAMVEFWHNWAMKLAPAQVTRFNTRLTQIANVVRDGAPGKATYDGKEVTGFNYTPTATDPAAVEKQTDILLAAMDAAYHWSADEDGKGKYGKAEVTISKAATGAPINNPRNFSMRFAEDVRNGLQQVLPAETFKTLLVRYRYALVDEANIARRREGRAPLDPSSVLLAHPQLGLYVDVDSPHSFESVGCTSCHDGSGQETDFVLTAHMARDIFVDTKTGAPVLTSQLKDAHLAGAEHAEQRDLSSMLEAVFPESSVAGDKQVGELLFDNAPSTQPSEEDSHGAVRPVDYVDPVTGKEGKALKQADYWVRKYEPSAPRSFKLVYHEWDWPMRAPEYLQANCARCHTDVYGIKETAPILYEGRQLFTQMGCVNCHQMDSIPSYENRKVGTDLRHVNAKLSPAYINTWIWAPKAFRPTTKMPHFFMLENNSSDEELRRTQQEARAITEYLVRTASPSAAAHAYPSGGKGAVEAGKAVFETIGCMACHQNLNENGEKWITTDLQKRGGMDAEKSKTAYDAMGYNERQMYVQQHLAEAFGHNTVAKYADGTNKPIFVQVGPELSGIGTKLTSGRTEAEARQWLYDWVMEPRHYSDYTIMPRLRLTEQQGLDIVEYLLNQKRTTTDPKDKWAAGLIEPDSEELKTLTALQLRGRYSVQTSIVKADDDAELTALATSALTTPITTADQAKAIASGMKKDEKRMVFLGQKLIAHYGCMSCHAINGMETTSSPCANLSDWGQKSVDKLDYGYLDHHHVEEFLKEGVKTKGVMLVNGLSPEAAVLGHQSIKPGTSSKLEVTWPEIKHTRTSWITQKLKNTRIYDRGQALKEPSKDDPGKPYDKLKMPTFYLNDDQVHAIVTFVISNRDRLITEKLTNKATNEISKTIARGRELTERFNCVACHQIEKNVPQIQQYFASDKIATEAPPSLRGEGNKIQYGWLFSFFKNVEPLRPLIFNGIRMPSFPATEEEFSAIVAYFNAISNKEAKGQGPFAPGAITQLARQIDPVVKYIEAQKKVATTQPTDASQAWPGDDWWQRPEFAGALAALKDWGLTFGHIKPVEIGIGAIATPADLRKVYRELLFKARFTQTLYAAPYPFVDQPRPEISDARFKLGEKLFYELQCLKCHVLGDPNIPGANKTPTAPNLSLTSRRLQQRWVRNWVQEPGVIQVGTPMPPFFTGTKDIEEHYLYKLDGQSFARAQKTERPAEAVEADYGKTVQEQTALLLDFLYAAGVRGYTGVQPAAPATQPTASADVGSQQSLNGRAQ